MIFAIFVIFVYFWKKLWIWINFVILEKNIFYKLIYFYEKIIIKNMFLKKFYFYKRILFEKKILKKIIYVFCVYIFFMRRIIKPLKIRRNFREKK